MDRFHTGFYSTDLRGAPAHYRGAGFVLEKESGRFPGMPAKLKYHQNRLSRSRRLAPTAVYDAGNNDVWLDGEIMIRTPNHPSAKRVFNLFVASIAVCDGDIRWLRHPLEVDRLALESEKPDRQFETSREGLTRACQLAAKASRSLSSVYAVHKLYHSYQSCAVSWADLHPTSGKIYVVEKDPIAHVHLANAISLAYSAIEELELEIRVPLGKSRRQMEPGGEV